MVSDHLFRSVSGDLLMKLGRVDEAKKEFERAIALTENVREQELLSRRLREIELARGASQD